MKVVGMKSNKRQFETLRAARRYQGVYLAVIPVFGFLALLTVGNGEPFGGASFLNLMEVGLGVLAVGNLVAGHYLPVKTAHRLLASGYLPDRVLLISQVFRMGTYEAVAVYGLLLSILGAGWSAIIPFFVVAVAALVLTFPTQVKWERLVAQIGPIAPK
jgi:hypothetical protein